MPLSTRFVLKTLEVLYEVLSEGASEIFGSNWETSCKIYSKNFLDGTLLTDEFLKACFKSLHFGTFGLG